jgi:hypothetical protein
MIKKHIAHSDDPHFENEVKDLLLFRKIVEVEALSNQIGVLTLDNGIQLIVEGNEGCGGCSNGWYDLEELNNCDNAITNVECVLEEIEWEDVYHIFVYAENKKINCIEYRGHDNGYYGTGYDLFVRMKGTE